MHTGAGCSCLVCMRGPAAICCLHQQRCAHESMQLGLSMQMYACVQAGQLSCLTNCCHITGTATDTKMQATCMQSSAVGASTTARGELRRVRLSLAQRSSSRMRCTSGSRYASVFPLPAWDARLQRIGTLQMSHPGDACLRLGSALQMSHLLWEGCGGRWECAVCSWEGMCPPA